MIRPEVGDAVYSATFELVGEVVRKEDTWGDDDVKPGVWFIVDHGDGVSAARTDELVVPSKHAQMRWSRRVAGNEARAGDYDPAESVVGAWARGIELERHGMDGDEVRLDPDTGAVLVLQGNAVATVISPKDRKPRLSKAVAKAQ